MITTTLNTDSTPEHLLAPPRKAFATVHPCEVVKVHQPRPVITEFHHGKPIFLQNRLYGRIKFGPDLWVCSNCHEAIHAWLYWLLGERQKPPYMGRNAMAAAESTYQWYTEELEKK